MASILENYLYLLTEDPELDALQNNTAKSRKKMMKLGTGPDGAEALSAKYNGVDPKRIPEHHKKILNDYREAIEEYQTNKDIEKRYSEWVTKGKRGPDPRTTRSTRSTSTGFNSEEWLRRKQEEAAKKEAAKLKNKIKQGFERGKAAFQKLNKNVKYAGATVIALLLLHQSYKIYKYHFSAAARSCNKYTGSYKDICMMQYRINALTKQRHHLIDGKKHCDTTNKPETCKQHIDDEVNSLNERINKIRVKAYEEYHIKI